MVQNVVIHLEKYTKLTLWRDILNCTRVLKSSRKIFSRPSVFLLVNIAEELDTPNRQNKQRTGSQRIYA